MYSKRKGTTDQMTLDLYGIRQRQGNEGIPVAKLLDKDVLLPLVKDYGIYLETTSLAIAGSLFIKRYAVITAAVSLDYFGFLQQKADWWSNAHFDAKTFTMLIDESPVGLLDENWKDELFINHLTPMIQMIAKECKINERILWENVAVRLNSVFREYEHSYSSEQIDAQYNDITSPNCSWLGKDTNPLQLYVHKQFIDAENPKRKTCCRYYEVSKAGELPYCNVCPLKKKV